MTVGELITELQKFPADKKLLMWEVNSGEIVTIDRDGEGIYYDEPEVDTDDTHYGDQVIIALQTENVDSWLEGLKEADSEYQLKCTLKRMEMWLVRMISRRNICHPQ